MIVFLWGSPVVFALCINLAGHMCRSKVLFTQQPGINLSEFHSLLILSIYSSRQTRGVLTRLNCTDIIISQFFYGPGQMVPKSWTCSSDRIAFPACGLCCRMGNTWKGEQVAEDVTAPPPPMPVWTDIFSTAHLAVNPASGNEQSDTRIKTALMPRFQWTEGGVVSSVL